MGHLLRILLKLFGKQRPEPTKLCSVSRTIESLPGDPRQKWISSGILHSVPVAIVLIYLFMWRAEEITHSKTEVACLLLATLWAWIGPYLIWRYESFTLPKFICDCRAIMPSVEERAELAKIAESNLHSFWFARWFVPVWIAAVSFAFISVREFVIGFGVRGYTDPLWWALFIGVISFSYYTSLGFCLAYKATILVDKVSRSRLDKVIYHTDGIFGLAFVGDFSFTTTAMFFTGWLFGPLIFFSANQSDGVQFFVSTPALLLEIFFLFIAASFLLPIYIVHKRLVQEKCTRAVDALGLVNQITQNITPQAGVEVNTAFDLAKKVLTDIQSVPNWPLRLDTAIKFSAAYFLSPTLAAAVGVLLKSKFGVSG